MPYAEIEERIDQIRFVFGLAVAEGSEDEGTEVGALLLGDPGEHRNPVHVPEHGLDAVSPALVEREQLADEAIQPGSLAPQAVEDLRRGWRGLLDPEAAARGDQL